MAEMCSSTFRSQCFQHQADHHSRRHGPASRKWWRHAWLHTRVHRCCSQSWDRSQREMGLSLRHQRRLHASTRWEPGSSTAQRPCESPLQSAYRYRFVKSLRCHCSYRFSFLEHLRDGSIPSHPSVLLWLIAGSVARSHSESMSRLPKNGQGLNMREKWVTNILLTHKMRQTHSHRSFREPIGRQRESHQSNQLPLEHLQKTRGKWTGSKNEKIRCSIRGVYLL